MPPLKLYNPQQAHKALTDLWQHIKAALVDGKRLDVVVREESKTRDQEQKYHAMIGEIAKQAQHLGSTWDAESWKRLLVHKFCKEIGLTAGRVIPNLDGDGIVQLDFQTRKFTKDQASQFVEWLHAWGSENGVTFSAVMDKTD